MSKVNDAAAQGAQLFLYGEIGEAWPGKKSITAESVKAQLEEIGTVDELTVHINSVGGDLFEGTAICNLLRQHPARVVVMVDGFACSVASVIAMAGDVVKMPRNAMLMIHNCWTFAIGNAADLRKVADDMDKMMAANRTAYLDKARGKLTEEKLIELLDAETFLSAEEAVALGLADEVIDYAGADTPAQLKQAAGAKNFSESARIAAALTHRVDSLTTEEGAAQSTAVTPEDLPSEDIEADAPETPAEEKPEPVEAPDFLAALAKAAERIVQNEKS